MPELVPQSPIPHYFDTVTLGNFALCDRFDLLVDRYGPALILTEQVRVELAQGRSAGYVKLARRTCANHEVLVSGTIGILKALCIGNQLTPDAADSLLAAMVAQGFHSPVRRISDLL